jgi:hypothetical protein
MQSDNMTIQQAIDYVKETGESLMVESLETVDNLRKQIKSRKRCRLVKASNDSTIVRIYPSHKLRNYKNLFSVKI